MMDNLQLEANISVLHLHYLLSETELEENTFARYVNPNTQAVNRIADVLSAYQTQASSELVSESVN